jgi:hypothetical protein
MLQWCYKGIGQVGTMHGKFKQLTVSSVHPLQDFADLSKVCEFEYNRCLIDRRGEFDDALCAFVPSAQRKSLNTISILGR